MVLYRSIRWFGQNHNTTHSLSPPLTHALATAKAWFNACKRGIKEELSYNVEAVTHYVFSNFTMILAAVSGAT